MAAAAAYFLPPFQANFLHFLRRRVKIKQLIHFRGGICLKRRIFALAVCLCMVFGLALTVRADSTASSIQIYASVNEDGQADVTMTVRLRIETAVETLYFPLPLKAEDIRLNDGGATTSRNGTATQVKLPSSVTSYVGDHVLTFKFKIPNVVSMVEDPDTGKRNLTLELPLLSGFEFPVQSVTLAVTLPENIEGRPMFKSTYYQADIDKLLSVTVSSNMITGQITQQLKDHETLSLTMVVPESMFDGVNTYVRVGNPEVIPMLIFAAVALVYWIIFLRGKPLVRQRRNSPPEGITAGELGVRLTFAGTDLTAMIFSWAQMGYILIQLDDRGRVWLHKKMNMGNERTAFEVKTFNTLFGKRDIAEATGKRYAELSRHLMKLNPSRKALNHPKCGNPVIFRVAMAGILAMSGVCYAMNFTGLVAMQVILAIFLAAVGGVTGWFIQSGMYRLHLRDKLSLILSLTLAALWFLLGLWAGVWLIGLLCPLSQLLAGLMAAYGGRRTELGRQNAIQILGLHQYLRKVDRAELKRIQENDPEYFYNLLPFALALGVESTFAERFGTKKLPACPYFTCGVQTRMTAPEWAKFFRETARLMDERRKRMETEKYAALWLR